MYKSNYRQESTKMFTYLATLIIYKKYTDMTRDSLTKQLWISGVRYQKYIPLAIQLVFAGTKKWLMNVYIQLKEIIIEIGLH